MIQSKTILKSLPHVLKTVDISGFEEKYQGKVRDIYIKNGQRIMITTDRQSAFDVILGHIPYKGAVLNQLSAFWNDKTEHILPNHMISLPHPNVMLAKECELIPIEMVVRGYITGVTVTSPWGNYEKGERVIYGIRFPDGLRKNQRLPNPIITPTYHGDLTGKGGHDTRLTKKDILEKKLASKKLYEQMEQVALDLFDLGSKLCKKSGLILVDTKYEFGLYQDKLTLIDEIHTPDSSRFWIAETYKERFEKGQEPENFDKEFLRLWYAARGYRGDGTPPKMTDQLIVDLAKRYIAVYEKITGKKFKAFKYPVEKKIIKAITDEI